MAGSKMCCWQCLVSGRVQGVFYRASAVRQAQALSIRGHVKNLTDGRVEVLACGSESTMNKFHEWLWQGSVAARVDEVRCTRVDQTPPPGFTSQ